MGQIVLKLTVMRIQVTDLSLKCASTALFSDWLKFLKQTFPKHMSNPLLRHWTGTYSCPRFSTELFKDIVQLNEVQIYHIDTFSFVLFVFSIYLPRSHFSFLLFLSSLFFISKKAKTRMYVYIYIYQFLPNNLMFGKLLNILNPAFILVMFITALASLVQRESRK